MPIFREFIENDIQILIWKYDENENLNLQDFLDNQTLNSIKTLHPKRQKEVSMTRKMLQILLPNYQLFYKENKEPYLNPTDRYISISHSFPFAAIAISKNKIGIDLERIQPKLQILKSKFLYKTEYNWIQNTQQELEFLTAIWAIKEALYKVDSAKYWSFREHYEIDFFSLKLPYEIIKCRIFDNFKSNEYIAKLKKIEDFYLAIVKK